MKKRVLSFLLALCLILSALPVGARAADCGHHQSHTPDCGFRGETAASPCTHSHTQGCFGEKKQCVHACSESCTYGEEGICNAHGCTVEEGCIIKTLRCAHVHDALCGYAPAQPGTPCTFDAEKCPQCASPDPKPTQEKTTKEKTPAKTAISQGEGLSVKTLSVPFGTGDSGLRFHVTAQEGAQVTYLWYLKGENNEPLNTGPEADISGLKAGVYTLYCVASCGEDSITSGECTVTITRADSAFTARPTKSSFDWGAEIPISLTALTPGGEGLRQTVEVYQGAYTGKATDKLLQTISWYRCLDTTVKLTQVKSLTPGEKPYTLTLRYPGDDDRNPSTSIVEVIITDCVHRSGDAEGKCTVCGTAMAASVKSGTELLWYTDLAEALKKASEGTENNPADLTLWQDAPKGLNITAGVIRLDLNGCTVSGLTLSGTAQTTVKGGTLENTTVGGNARLVNRGATMKGTVGVAVTGGAYEQEDGTVTGTSSAVNSSGGAVAIRGGRVDAGGVITFQCGGGSLEITGGTVITKSDTFYGDFSGGLPVIRGGTFLGGIKAAHSGGTVLLEDLLPEGYALKTADGWEEISGKGYLTEDCTVAPVPLTITRQPENVFIPEAGGTGTLTVAASSNHPLSYQWYRIDGARERLLEGQTGPELTAQEPVGGISEYYFCIVTADGYSLRTKKAAVTAGPSELTIADAVLEGTAGNDGWIREGIRLVPPAVEGMEVLICLAGTEDWATSLTAAQLPQGEYDLTYLLARGVNGAAQLPYAQKTIHIRHDSEKPAVQTSCAPEDMGKRGALVTVTMDDGPKGSDIAQKQWTESGGKTFTALWEDDGSVRFMNLQPGTDYQFLLTVTDRAGNSTETTLELTTKADPLADARLTVEGEYVYSGQPQSPTVVVTHQGQPLTEQDYVLWYAAGEGPWSRTVPTDAGTYRLLLCAPGETPDGEEGGHGAYTIRPKVLEVEAQWEGGEALTKPYDGTTRVHATVVLYLKGAVGTDTPRAEAAQWAYNSPNVADATQVIGSGIALTEEAVSRNYALATTQVTIPGVITRSTPTLAFASAYAPDRAYNGLKLENPAEGDMTITGATYAHVTFQWSDSKGHVLAEAPADAGEYHLQASIAQSANTHAAQTEKRQVIIAPKQVKPTVTVTETAIYNGKAQTPAVEVYDGDHLIPAGEYTVSYLGNVEAGTNAAKVTVTDREGGNYLILESAAKFSILRDQIAPVIRGIRDGGKYYGETLFTVEDENLLSVTIDGRKTTSYRIAPDNKAHTVTATDKGGNATTVTILVYKTYEVVYKAQGMEVDRQTVNHGTDAQPPDVPVRPGYRGQWEDDGKNITADRVINAQYQRSGQELPTPIELLGEPDEYKLILTEGVQVCGQLWNIPGRDTEEEIRASLLGKLSGSNAAVRAGRTCYYDVTLWVSTDDGVTWRKATSEDLPEDGVTVILPYPSGTDRRRYDFMVAHMYSRGADAGKIELPEVKKTGDGIRIKVKGFSPVAVSWVNSSLNDLWESMMSTMTGNPPTGDPFPMELWLSVMALSGTGLAGMLVGYQKRRRGEKRQ